MDIIKYKIKITNTLKEKLIYTNIEMENQDRLRKMENQYRLRKIQTIIQSKILNEYDVL